MGAVEEALSVPAIIHEVICYACCCCFFNRSKPCVRDHLNYILVSKLWAKIAIPKHWSRHAKFENYLSLMYDEKVCGHS